MRDLWWEPDQAPFAVSLLGDRWVRKCVISGGSLIRFSTVSQQRDPDQQRDPTVSQQRDPGDRWEPETLIRNQGLFVGRPFAVSLLGDRWVRKCVISGGSLIRLLLRSLCWDITLRKRSLISAPLTLLNTLIPSLHQSLVRNVMSQQRNQRSLCVGLFVRSLM